MRPRHEHVVHGILPRLAPRWERNPELQAVDEDLRIVCCLSGSVPNGFVVDHATIRVATGRLKHSRMLPLFRPLTSHSASPTCHRMFTCRRARYLHYHAG